MRQPVTTSLVLPFLLVLVGCAARVESDPAPAARRIVPLVDHHQHIMSAAMISPESDALPLIDLPAELAAVLEARDRVVVTGEPGDLFSPDAVIRDPINGVWMRGADGIEEISGMYSSDTRFFANGYTLGTNAATITGPIRDGDLTADWLHYSMGLVRDGSGAWRIASETASLLPPRLFAEEITAEHLIGDLDDVGIDRAVVLSVAYWHGEGDSPADTREEYAKVRAENDWTAAQVARYPDRLVLFCGIPPRRDYAETEVRRCARELGARGIKMHFRSADVDLYDATHVAQVRRVFEVANEEGLAIVVHNETDDDYGEYGREVAQIFVDRILPAAPDVVVQIAHLWGGNEITPGALEVYAHLSASGDPRARNLYFDLAEIVRGALGSDANLERIARAARQIGMDRLLYGSDASGSFDLPPSTLGWGRIMRQLPLTDAELADIADNVAPYMRS